MDTRQPAYFMVFLGASAGGDLKQYRQEYLSGKAVSPSGVRPVAEEQPGSQRGRREDVPLPLADPEAIKAKLPVEARSYVERVLPVALRSARTSLPLLPGETIERDAMTALAADWNGVPKGTAIYRRETNRGVIAFGLLPVSIDLEAGATAYARRPGAPEPELPADLAGVAISDSTKTVIDAALTIAEFTGFALGPSGMVLAGGAAVLMLIFNRCVSTEHVPLSTQVAEAVKAVGVELKLESVDATIGTNFDWVRDYYDAAWASHPAPVTDEEYQEFKRHLGDKLAADTGIVHDVNLLNEPSFRVPGFPLYLLGASLVLLLLKIELLIQSSEKSVVDTKAFTALINTLGKYIDAAEATKALIDGKIVDRLGKISNVHRNESCAYSADPVPDATCFQEWDYEDDVRVFRFEDTYEGCQKGWVQHKSDAEKSRAAYYAKVRNQLNLQYYRGDPQKSADVIAKWKATLAEYHSYTPAI